MLNSNYLIIRNHALFCQLKMRSFTDAIAIMKNNF